MSSGDHSGHVMRRVIVAGDDTTGRFVPDDVRSSAFRRLDRETIRRLSDARGLTATASDVLDELGYALAVAGSVLMPRGESGRSIAGHVLTLRYLPERRRGGESGLPAEEPGLAHHVVFELAKRGDVVVVEAAGVGGVSVFGGMAALAARRAGIAGCIIDGSVRDLSDIRAVGLPVWSRSVTPITGKWRAVAEAINGPVCCGEVQVRAGDLALADDTGICFVPSEVADAVAERVLDVASRETNAYEETPDGR